MAYIWAWSKLLQCVLFMLCYVYNSCYVYYFNVSFNKYYYFNVCFNLYYYLNVCFNLYYLNVCLNKYYYYPMAPPLPSATMLFSRGALRRSCRGSASWRGAWCSAPRTPAGPTRASPSTTRRCPWGTATSTREVSPLPPLLLLRTGPLNL